MNTNFRTSSEYDNLVNELRTQVFNSNQLYEMVTSIFTTKMAYGEVPRPINDFVKVVLSKIYRLSLQEKYAIRNDAQSHVVYELVQDIYTSINKTEETSTREEWAKAFDRKNSACKKQLIKFVKGIVDAMIDDMEEAYEYLWDNGFIQMIADAATYQAETNEEKKEEILEQDPLIPTGVKLLNHENEYYIKEDGSVDADRLVANAVRGSVKLEEDMLNQMVEEIEKQIDELDEEGGQIHISDEEIDELVESLQNDDD